MELFGQHILDFPDNDDSVGFFGIEGGPRVAESDEYLLDLGMSCIDNESSGARRKTSSISFQDVSKKLEDWGLVLPSPGESADLASACEEIQDDSADSMFSEESFRSELSEEPHKFSMGISSNEDSIFCGQLSSEEVIAYEEVVGDDKVEELSDVMDDTCLDVMDDTFLVSEEDIMKADFVSEDIIEVSTVDSLEVSIDSFQNSPESLQKDEGEVFSDNISDDHCDTDSFLLNNESSNKCSIPPLDDIFEDNSNCSSDLGYSSPIKHDPLSDIDIDSILSSKSISEAESITSKSELIGGANCDFIEEFRGLKSFENSFLPEDLETEGGVEILGFDASSLSLDSEVQEEEGINCDLDMFDFNLSPEDGQTESESICEDIGSNSDIQMETGEIEIDMEKEEKEENEEKEEEEEEEEDLDLLSTDLWNEIFSVSEMSDCTNSEYDDLLDSILSTADSLDPEYFQSLASSEFDIDSVDPTCTPKCDESEDEIKEETVEPEEEKVEVKEEIVEIKEEKPETLPITSHLYTDHDYTIPRSSSLFLTPPHSSGEDSESEASSALPYTVKYNHHSRQSLLNQKHHKVSSSNRSLIKTISPSKSKKQQQVIKFQHKKDLKFVINLAVQKDAQKTNARSILKNKIMTNRLTDRKEKFSNIKKEKDHKLVEDARPKTAKEMVRDIIERRSLSQDIQEKREFVKNMKKRMRQQSREDRNLQPRTKYRCIEPEAIVLSPNCEVKSDDKKYRKFEEERELHNSMERQRRVELKDNYDTLRAVIPSISTADKVSKLMILNTAGDYCKSLEARLGRLELLKQQQEENKRRLQEKLNLLKIGLL